MDTDDTTSGPTTGGVVLGLCAVAILGGLWRLREGRAPESARPQPFLDRLTEGGR